MSREPSNIPGIGRSGSAWDLAKAWPYNDAFDPDEERPTTITWKDGKGRLNAAPIGYPVQALVNQLGIHLAAKFLFVFGGSEVYVGRTAKALGRLAYVLGYDGAAAITGEALASITRGPVYRVPLCHCFLARYLRGRGESNNRITSILKVSPPSLALWLRPDTERRASIEEANEKRMSYYSAEARRLGLSVLPPQKLKPTGAPK